MDLMRSHRMRGYPHELVRTGLVYNTPVKANQPDSYFDDTHVYTLDDSEAAVLGNAAARLFQAYIVAGDYAIKYNLFKKFGIPEFAIKAILDTWEDNKASRYAPSVYGRFDLRPVLERERTVRRSGRRVYRRPGKKARRKVVGAKLLEFNADTPTSLVETGISQWVWFSDARKSRRMKRLGHIDQWNELHESIVERWKSEVEAYRERTGRPVTLIHFGYTNEETEGEDYMTAEYMRVMASEASNRLIAEGKAGFRTKLIDVEQIKMHTYEPISGIEDESPASVNLRKDHTISLGSFTADGFVFTEEPVFDLIEDADFYDDDPNGSERIQMCFKLYAWEHIIWEPFGPQIIKNTLKPNGTTWVEAAYKLLWSNKAMLAILWEIFGDPTTVRQKLDDAGINLADYTEWLGDPETIHELLLPTFFEGEQPKGFELNCARKPFLGREGADVCLFLKGIALAAGELQGYGEEGFVLQQLAVLESFRRDGVLFYPVAGVWMVVDKAVALCFRHDSHPVTGNLSRFCPHILRMGR